MSPGRLRAALAPPAARAVQHPVLAAAVVAVLARLAFVASSAGQGVGAFAPDERSYIELAAVVARGDEPASWQDGYGASLYRSTLAFTGPLALAFRLSGPARPTGQLLALAFGALTAALAARLALELVPRHLSLAAGLIVAVLPSQVLWSSLVLRESMVWAALAALALSLVWATERPTAALVLAGAALAALGFLRAQTMLVAAAALVLAALLLPRVRWSRAAGALLLALVVPALAGTGVGGVDLVRSAAPALSTTREALSAGAESAIVDSGRPSSGVEVGDGSSGALEIARRAEREDAAGRPAEGVAATLRAVPGGVAAFLLRPFPGERTNEPEVVLAQAENLLWYVLLVPAAGALLLLRRSPASVAFPSLVVAGLVALNAVAQGNVGTAFRHRGQVAWAIAVLAVAGGAELARRWRAVPGRTGGPGG